MPLWHNKDKSENPCVAMSWRFVLILFPLKNGPKTGSTRGGKKPGLHLKDKFSLAEKEVKMGSWGITMRQSDYGLDLLGTIIDTQLKEADFAAFDVADALEVIKTDIMEEIRRANRGCSAADLVFYFGENFPQSFTQGALLIAECLSDYYHTGKLKVSLICDNAVWQLRLGRKP